MKETEDLNKINEEIEAQLIKEMENEEDVKRKKSYLSFKFLILLGFLIFMLYGALKPFFA